MPLTGYRVSLHGPGAELEEGFFKPPGVACSAPSSGPAARVKCTHNDKLVGTMIHVFTTPVEILSNVTDVFFFRN